MKKQSETNLQTAFFMRQITRRSALASLLATAFTITSCIYESPVDDEFYRTLWSSSEAPFEEFTLEFLCNGSITAQASNAAGSFGTYEHEGFTAYFTGLRLTMNDSTILIREAHRTGDTLTVIWHFDDSGTTYGYFGDSGTTYATKMVRLSGYR